jgi:hypothetical protein
MATVAQMLVAAGEAVEAAAEAEVVESSAAGVAVAAVVPVVVIPGSTQTFVA